MAICKALFTNFFVAKRLYSIIPTVDFLTLRQKFEMHNSFEIEENNEMEILWQPTVVIEVLFKCRSRLVSLCSFHCIIVGLFKSHRQTSLRFSHCCFLLTTKREINFCCSSMHVEFFGQNVVTTKYCQKSSVICFAENISYNWKRRERG